MRSQKKEVIALEICDLQTNKQKNAANPFHRKPKHQKFMNQKCCYALVKDLFKNARKYFALRGTLVTDLEF